MKITKNISLYFLVATLSFFSGCSQNAENILMSQITSQKVVKVAVSKEDAPYSYKKTNSQEYDGIEIQIAKRLAQGLEVELEIVPVERENLILALSEGTAQLAMGRLPSTLAQQYDVDSSISYMGGNIYAVTKRGTAISTKGAMDGKIILCSDKLSASTMYQLNDIDATVLGNDGSIDIESYILDGMLDVYICYEDEANIMAKSDALQAQVISNIEPENYVVLTLKNNGKLLKNVNDTLTKMLDSDIISEIISSF